MENRENDMEKAGSSPLLEVEHLEVSFLSMNGAGVKKPSCRSGI